MINALINHLLDKAGLVRKHAFGLSFDYDTAFRDIFFATKNFTMTSPERMYAMYKAVEYVQKNSIAGDIVECGVWRGGMMMIAAEVLKKMNQNARALYLYDTYAGMTKPGAEDKTVYDGAEAIPMWKKDWCLASFEEVQNNMASTGYPKNKMVFIRGDVLKTIPKHIPKKISILRLDTDWYESTKHELTHLFPRLVNGGVLIIDDYGHWQGARKAVDEYFQKHHSKMFLSRIDYSGRIGIKY